MLLGTMATINQDLDKDTVELIASEYGVDVEEVIVLEETELEKYEEPDQEEDLEIRPPVVTSWATSTTEKQRFLTASEKRRSSKAKPEASHSILALIRSRKTAKKSPSLTLRATPHSHDARTRCGSYGYYDSRRSCR
jgi:hypothetical protein